MDEQSPIYEKQAAMLVNAGMRSSTGLSDMSLRQEIAKRLKYINFHRFEAYWWDRLISTRQEAQLRFRAGVYWEDIMDQYMFDRKLRQIASDSTARIEVALRTLIAHLWTENTKCDSPQRSSNNYNLSFPVGDFLSTVEDYYQKSTAEDAIRYRNLYADVRVLPVGIFVEFTSFGNLRKLLAKGFKRASKIAEKVAASMGIPNDLDFFLSGISLLRDVRNSCAHQSRIWNRRWLGKSHNTILRKGKNPFWKYRWDNATQTWSPTGKGDMLVRGMDTTAAALTFSYQLMKTIAPHSHWKKRLTELLSSAIGVPKHAHKGIGFTNPHWMDHPLWN